MRCPKCNACINQWVEHKCEEEFVLNASGFIDVSGYNNSIKQPVYKWKMKLFKDDSLIWQKEKAPCLFHRFMQKLIFGFDWKRIK